MSYHDRQNFVKDFVLKEFRYSLFNLFIEEGKSLQYSRFSFPYMVFSFEYSVQVDILFL